MMIKGQQTNNLDFFFGSVISEPITETDSIVNYADFLVDSLNSAKTDSTFRFELKDIVLPEANSDSIPLQPVYDKPSIFVHSKIHPIKINPISRPENNYDWITSLFLICLIVLAWIRYYNMRRIKQVFRAVIGRHNVNQLVRDGNLAQERITPGLVLIYLTSLAVIVHQFGSLTISSWLGLENPLFVFLIIIVSIALLWLLKILIIKGTGLIFRTRQDTSELVLTNLIFNASTGIAMFPFILAGFYSGNMLILQIAAGILLTGMILRFFRNVVVGFSAQTFSVLYLFLYLCTLEILPVLFLYRIVTFTD